MPRRWGARRHLPPSLPQAGAGLGKGPAASVRPAVPSACTWLMLHKLLFLTIPSSESFSAVGFLWLEPCIKGSSQTTEAAGTSSILILDPWMLRIAVAVLGVCGASVSRERK